MVLGKSFKFRNRRQFTPSELHLGLAMKTASVCALEYSANSLASNGKINDLGSI